MIGGINLITDDARRKTIPRADTITDPFTTPMPGFPHPPGGPA